MKTILTILNLFLILTLSNQDLQAQNKKSKKEQKQAYLENIKKDSIDGVYIPTDLNDCFKQIDSFWADSIKTKVRKMTENEFTVNAHFGIGMWMRNNWRLWGGSRLSKYFNDIGVFHPDDMSGIILTSYHRYLLGQDIKLEEQINYYKDFWKKNKQ
ncbi:MAG: DUF6794 domain-containing protein [Paludibacter sp.]|nr:DUF6794 domain-containing protein [Paludibacter sp.]